ncbi:MAG TPA: hypothetical protein PLG79_12540 [Spirochaetales bacterium]|nr:hypothetical protein [Spirochaetales bacterium]HOV39548.1 hypothetical protein [Spirochaetales bacterium]
MGKKNTKKKQPTENPPSRVYRLEFYIQRWKHWDAEIDAEVKLFRKKYPVYPQILLASSATLKKFDMIAFTFHPENLIFAGEGEAPLEPVLEPGEGLSGIGGKGYELDFCFKEDAPLGYCCLVYDSDPDGGEPLPDFSFPDLTLWEGKVRLIA